MSDTKITIQSVLQTPEIKREIELQTKVWRDAFNKMSKKELSEAIAGHLATLCVYTAALETRMDQLAAVMQAVTEQYEAVPETLHQP